MDFPYFIPFLVSFQVVYKWYILPIGGLYATYHLLGEPETTIEVSKGFSSFFLGFNEISPSESAI